MRFALSAALLVTALLVVYLPDVGHGFIKDDFRWIDEASRIRSAADAAHTFRENVGFYRPVVVFSFAADHAVWGLNPRGYGLTNLALLLVDALLVFLLARRLSVPPEGALVGAAVWVFNFHGVNMAVLWTSGRTALLMCLFALSALLAYTRGRWTLAGVLSLLAMLCKEEAACLPFVFTIAAWLDGESRLVARVWPAWAALGVYLLLRHDSGAFGPLTAPDYYQFTASPPLIVRNVLEYADRGATVAAVVVIVLLISVGAAALSPERHRRLIRIAALWFVGFYALTVFLPVRSDLYALAPAVGSALLASAVAASAAQINPSRFRSAVTVLLVLTLAAIPIYRTRNGRWVRPAELTANALRTVQSLSGRPSGHVTLVDDPGAAVTLDSGFGALFPDAVRLVLGDGWTGEIRDGRSVRDDTATDPHGDSVIAREGDAFNVLRSPE